MNNNFKRGYCKFMKVNFTYDLTRWDQNDESTIYQLNIILDRYFGTHGWDDPDTTAIESAKFNGENFQLTAKEEENIIDDYLGG